MSFLLPKTSFVAPQKAVELLLLLSYMCVFFFLQSYVQFQVALLTIKFGPGSFHQSRV